MFRVSNRNKIVGNYQNIVLAVRNFTNLSGSKLNNASRIGRCVINTGRLNNTNGTGHNGRLRVACELPARLFHVTASKQALPPIFVIIIFKPLSKIAAIFFGRTFRKWWGALPAERKQALLLRLKGNRTTIVASSVVATAGMVWYYTSHLEEDPITGRKKFITFSNDQIMQLAHIELMMQAELHKEHFLPPTHPAYKRVATVANQLLKSNRDIQQLQQTNWVVTVVDEPTVNNAFVLPTGHIFIFTGILNVCNNDDQLCVILAHEISHVLLSHMAEQLSGLHLLDLLILVPLAFVWAVLPDAAALITQWLSGYFTKVAFQLPFSRALEAEADQIGLQLTAKACYDVREASAFWGRMKVMDTELEWLSTHPSNETRQLILDSLMPTAIQLRNNCKCPQLPSVDPRTLIGVNVPAESSAL